MRKAEKGRRTGLKRWEEEWWNELGKRAPEAGRTGDQGEMYRILK